MVVAAGAIIEADDVFHDTDIQRFTANGTWTKPVGAKRVRVQVQGPGGAGGGAPATGAGEASAGAGGEAGSYAESWFDADDLAATESVVIGTGGAGVSAAAGNAGSAASTFSSSATLVSAAPGTFGNILTNAATLLSQTGGNTTSPSNTGDFTMAGQFGGSSLRNLEGSHGGAGGDSFFGRGGGQRSHTANGFPGTGYGSGGGGACNGASDAARTGGAGASGYCVVTTFI